MGGRACSGAAVAIPRTHAPLRPLYAPRSDGRAYHLRPAAAAVQFVVVGEDRDAEQGTARAGGQVIGRGVVATVGPCVAADVGGLAAAQHPP